MRATILFAAAALPLLCATPVFAQSYMDDYRRGMDAISNRIEQQYQLDALHYDMEKERARQDYLMDVEREKMRNELDHLRGQMEIDKSSANILRLERGW